MLKIDSRIFSQSRTKQIAQKNVIIHIFRPHGALNQLSLFLINSSLISASFLHVPLLFSNPEKTPCCTTFYCRSIFLPFAVNSKIMPVTKWSQAMRLLTYYWHASMFILKYDDWITPDFSYTQLLPMNHKI